MNSINGGYRTNLVRLKERPNMIFNKVSEHTILEKISSVKNKNILFVLANKIKSFGNKIFSLGNKNKVSSTGNEISCMESVRNPLFVEPDAPPRPPEGSKFRLMLKHAVNNYEKDPVNARENWL